MLERLLQLLEQIDENADIKDYGDSIIPSDQQDVQEATDIANDILITPSGGVNWEYVEILRDHGYPVFPLERDRFGWLVGGIATKKGTIAFG